MARQYVPDAGDVVWISFDAQAGREHAGHRPAVVLTPAAYNVKIGLMICCPITNQVKGYPFEVLISGQPACVALADHVKTLDWRARHAKRKGKISDSGLAEIRSKLFALLG
jgi:mRNA interferase MazF